MFTMEINQIYDAQFDPSSYPNMESNMASAASQNKNARNMSELPDGIHSNIEDDYVDITVPSNSYEEIPEIGYEALRLPHSTGQSIPEPEDKQSRCKCPMSRRLMIILVALLAISTITLLVILLTGKLLLKIQSKFEAKLRYLYIMYNISFQNSKQLQLEVTSKCEQPATSGWY